MKGHVRQDKAVRRTSANRPLGLANPQDAKRAVADRRPLLTAVPFGLRQGSAS
jgi:hypothetical protein